MNCLYTNEEMRKNIQIGEIYQIICSPDFDEATAGWEALRDNQELIPGIQALMEEKAEQSETCLEEDHNWEDDEDDPGQMYCVWCFTRIPRPFYIDKPNSILWIRERDRREKEEEHIAPWEEEDEEDDD